MRTEPCSVFALERDFVSLYTLRGELSQNQLTNASVLSLPDETLKTDGRNLGILMRFPCFLLIFKLVFCL